MSTWPSGIAAMTLFVDDLTAARDFYQRVFDSPPVFQDESSAVFRFGQTLVNLLLAGAAAELIDPAAVGARDAGPRAVYTLSVDDVDSTCADLASRGVELLNGPVDRPWGPRTASFRDPAGHVWEIAK